MTFINHPYLWGLFLALIPIIIYYLMRFRSLRVQWGGTYILERALERMKRKLYLKQLILLLLRVLAILLIVLAFARPVTELAEGQLGGTGAHHVFVVDGSYSMLAGQGGQTAFERAKTVMKKLIDAWGHGERWSLYLLDDDPHWVVEDKAIDNGKKAKAVVDELRTGQSRASMATSLQQVFESLKGQRAEIFVMADDQASTWKDTAGITVKPDTVHQVYWMRFALPSEQRNVAVESVSVSPEWSLSGHPSTLSVQVKNYGEKAVNELGVDILQDGTYKGEQAISLLPGQSRSLTAQLTFKDPGSHRASARIEDDILNYDNRMTAGVHTGKTLSVLVPRQPGRSGKFDSTAGFLKVMGRVLRNQEEQSSPGAALSPLSISTADGPPSKAELDRADVVFIDGGSPVNRAVASRLKDYMNAGGALIFAAGAAVPTQSWNSTFGTTGIMPATLGKKHRKTIGGEEYRQINRASLQDGLGVGIALPDALTGAVANNAKFYSWFDLQKTADSAVETITFTGGDPFVVVQRQELGSSMLLASGLNPADNNILVTPPVYPFVVRLFSQAAAGQFSPRTVTTRQAVKLHFAKGKAPDAVQFEQRDGETFAAAVRKTANGAVATVPADKTRIGPATLIVLRGSEPQRVHYGIQGERRDSNLTPLPDAARQPITSELGMEQVKNWDSLQQLLAGSRHGAECYLWVVLLVLAVLFGEMILERQFI